MNFSGKFGSDSTIWYPASGGLVEYSFTRLNGVGDQFSYSSVTIYYGDLYYGYPYLMGYYNGHVEPSTYGSEPYIGRSIRCAKVIDIVAEH